MLGCETYGSLIFQNLALKKKRKKAKRNGKEEKRLDAMHPTIQYANVDLIQYQVKVVHTKNNKIK